MLCGPLQWRSCNLLSVRNEGSVSIRLCLIVFSRFLAVLCVVCVPVLSDRAAADTRLDMQSLARAVAYVESVPTGHAQMAIVYDPDDEASVSHAREVLTYASGVGSKVKIYGVLRPVDRLDRIQARLVFLAQGVQSFYPHILAYARRLGWLTLSTEPGCVDVACVLVARAAPMGGVILNTELATVMGIDFVPAFRMMVEQRGLAASADQMQARAE